MNSSPQAVAGGDGSALRRQALGVVRSARSRITPQMAGLPEGSRRRTPACGARKWPSCAASASPGTPGSNRAAKCRCRPRSGRASPACCSWRAPNAPICSSWPTAPIRSRRATPAARQAAARLRGRDPRARLCAGPRLEPAGLERALARAVRRLAPARSRTQSAALHLPGPAARAGGGLGAARARGGRIPRRRRRAPGRARRAGAGGRAEPPESRVRPLVDAARGGRAGRGLREFQHPRSASWRSSRSPFDWPRIRT